MPSKIRIQNAEGEDLVTVCLVTGKVELKDPEQVEEAARSFWDCVALVRASFTGYADFVLRGSHDFPDTITGVLDACPKHKAGDILFQPGAAGEGGAGGDVVVYRGDTDLKEVEATVRARSEGNAPTVAQPHYANASPKKP